MFEQYRVNIHHKKKQNRHRRDKTAFTQAVWAYRKGIRMSSRT